ncbi:MAG: epoxyqueuosine reductase QueH, partial [Oscillospiraceae bacterium]|nr:epoxyqueuosine reductase QueH [Oscillospiraceae bacterium]
MHACCGPCAVYPYKVLARGHEVGMLFHNPNIHPEAEYAARLGSVRMLAESLGVPLAEVGGCDEAGWARPCGVFADRCAYCYMVRLIRTAEYAKENGYDAFTTSLLVSPYQRHGLIKAIGGYAHRRIGVPFLYADYREGYRKGKAEARSMGLYMQRHCGCVNSIGSGG